MTREESYYNSWEYLNNLKCVHYNGINRFDICLCVDVVKVNPDTDEIDDDIAKNTKVQTWLEFGGVVFDENFNCLMAHHDYNLDCGGDNFESAIITLAHLCKLNGYE